MIFGVSFGFASHKDGYGQRDHSDRTGCSRCVVARCEGQVVDEAPRRAGVAASYDIVCGPRGGVIPGPVVPVAGLVAVTTMRDMARSIVQLFFNRSNASMQLPRRKHVITNRVVRV